MSTRSAGPTQLLDRLPRGGFVRSVLVLVAGTGSAQLIVVASAPILTRLFTPSDYGAYAVAASLLNILITVACLRYELAVPLPASDDKAANVLALAVAVAVALSLVSAVLLWIAGPWLMTQLGAAALAPYTVLLSAGQLGGGIVAALTNWAIRTRLFAEIAANRLVQSGTLVGSQLVLGFASMGALGLLVGDIAGRAAGSTRLARAAWKSSAKVMRQVSRNGIVEAARRYRAFPLLSTWSALLAVTGVTAPMMLMVALYGAGTGGTFALAYRIGAIPLSLVARAVGQVFVSESAVVVRDSSAALMPLFRRTTFELARLAIGPFVLVAIAAPLLAGPVLGADWSATGTYLAVLAPSLYLEFVIGATGDVIYVVERQGLQLAREVVRFILIGGAVPLAAALQLPAVAAVVLVSLAGCATYALYGVVSWLAIRRRDAGRRFEA